MVEDIIVAGCRTPQSMQMYTYFCELGGMCGAYTRSQANGSHRGVDTQTIADEALATICLP